jgi:hypothetical protein
MIAADLCGQGAHAILDLIGPEEHAARHGAW